MKQAGRFFLFLAIICWGSIIGGIFYSHISYFPNYLSHLPESGVLANGPYPVVDEKFWMTIHPITIICTLLALLLNWKLEPRRKYILVTTIMYAVAIVSTFTYFVPELIEFSKSNQNASVTPAEWYTRGQRWQYLSWTRGAFMYVGFILLLIALTKNNFQRKNG